MLLAADAMHRAACLRYSPTYSRYSSDAETVTVGCRRSNTMGFCYALHLKERIRICYGCRVKEYVD